MVTEHGTLAPLNLGAINSNPGDFYVAETGRRFMAFLSDEFLRTLAFLPWILVVTSSDSRGGLWLDWFILCELYFVVARACCLKWLGATPGKYMIGLRVIGRDQPSLTWTQSFVRPLADDCVSVLGWATRALALLRFDRRHLSDWVATTQVVQLKPRKRVAHRQWFLAMFFFAFFAMDGLEASWRWLRWIGFA